MRQTKIPTPTVMCKNKQNGRHRAKKRKKKKKERGVEAESLRFPSSHWSRGCDLTFTSDLYLRSDSDNNTAHNSVNWLNTHHTHSAIHHFLPQLIEYVMKEITM